MGAQLLGRCPKAPTSSLSSRVNPGLGYERPKLFQVVFEVLFCQRLGLWVVSLFHSTCYEARVQCRIEMEEGNYLRMILSSTPPSLLGTLSQGSPPVSSIPSAPPPSPTSYVQAPVQDRHWSNEVLRFLLS